MEKNSQLLVSVIVPIYGVEKYIGKCLESLLVQDYQPLEIILVNDCTKDGSMTVVENLLKDYDKPHKILIVEHKENRGLSAARQTGINASSGIYLFHVDSDDYIEHDAISRMVSKAVSADYDIVIGATCHEYLDLSISDNRAVEENVNGRNYLSKVITQDIPNNIWGKLIRTSLYKDNGIKCLEEVSYGEDYAVLPKLLYYATRIGFVNMPLYHYTHYNESSYTNNYKWKNITDMFRTEKEITDFFTLINGYEEEIAIAHVKHVAWAIRQQVISKHSIKSIERYIDPLILPQRAFKKLEFNHWLIAFLYCKNYMRLLHWYIKLSNLLFVRRKK